jgi:arylsulfatase A-like enzyme
MQPSANKKILIGGAVLALSMTAIFLVLPSKPAPQPTIIYISIDSLRADHMGIYGYSEPTTPFLDSLMGRGVIFDRAYAPDYLTFQTNAAVLSGLYPSKNNVTTWNTPLRAEVQLLPEILKLYGYSTGAFVSPSMWKLFGFSRGFDTYSLETNPKNISVARKKIIEWMESNASPRFIFWHIYDVHLPFIPAEKPFLKNAYAGKFASTTHRFQWESQSTSTIRGKGGFFPIADADRDYLRAAYDTGIRAVDDELRAFYTSISSKVNLSNTIFVITAEHGEDLGEHGFIFHRDLYDVNTRVPLAIVYPAKLPPRRVETPVSLLDMMPTILSLGGMTPKEGIDGVDISPLAEGKRMAHRAIFMERPPFDEYAVIDWPYKYILRNADRTLPNLDEESHLFFESIRKNDLASNNELYNLAQDPEEQKNLTNTGIPEEQALLARLSAFKTLMQNARAINPPETVGPADVIIPYFEK